MEVHQQHAEPWKVTLVDTGADSMTGGRVKRVAPYLENETFMLTYGDGVADININDLLAFHKSAGKLATLTSVQLPTRFGTVETNESSIITNFKEKPHSKDIWINAGYFVLEPGIFNYLKGNMEKVQWEKEPMEKIVKDKQLAAYKHNGFWKCMDAMRDKIELEQLWESNQAKWKTW